MTDSEFLPEALVLYDRKGRAVAFSPDRVYLYGFEGLPLGYREQGSVYAFTGEHLGWWEHGWIRDHTGAAALFGGLAVGGPARPLCQALPARLPRHQLPRRERPAPAPPRPAPLEEWSARSGLHFFAPPTDRHPTWTELVDRALAQWQGMTSREVRERVGISAKVVQRWRRQRVEGKQIQGVRGQTAEALRRVLEQGCGEGRIPLETRVRPRSPKRRKRPE